MAEYYWNAPLLRHVFILPQEIADKHLRLAGVIQLRVLLWLARNGGKYDEEQCARVAGTSAAECRDAVRYWVDAGVLTLGEETAVTSVSAIPAATPATERSVPAARPQAVKPQLPEVIARRAENEEYAGLEDEVSSRMGRPLSPGDRETLLYLYDTAGLPAGVILMVVGYAAAAGRLSMRYIEKVALDWADRGIVTMAAAEEHLCYLERAQQALERVRAACELEKLPTGTAVLNAAEKWVCDWQFSDEVLRMAFAVCRQKTGKFQTGYMNRVLENWHTHGADTPEKVAALCGEKPATPNKPTDSEYETMVEQYIPVYKKKKKG